MNKNKVEMAHYVFQTVVGNTYKVTKDRFGEFKDEIFTENDRVKEYFESGYNVLLLDCEGNIEKVNF